jgi:hypothetical protein
MTEISGACPSYFAVFLVLHYSLSSTKIKQLNQPLQKPRFLEGLPEFKSGQIYAAGVNLRLAGAGLSAIPVYPFHS